MKVGLGWVKVMDVGMERGNCVWSFLWEGWEGICMVSYGVNALPGIGLTFWGVGSDAFGFLNGVSRHSTKFCVVKSTLSDTRACIASRIQRLVLVYK